MQHLYQTIESTIYNAANRSEVASSPFFPMWKGLPRGTLASESRGSLEELRGINSIKFCKSTALKYSVKLCVKRHGRSRDVLASLVV
jgi:hypothetical protein